MVEEIKSIGEDVYTSYPLLDVHFDSNPLPELHIILVNSHMAHVFTAFIILPALSLDCITFCTLLKHSLSPDHLQNT